jgi:hypothetical protein
MQVTEKPIAQRRRRIVSDWLTETQSLVSELGASRTPLEWVDFVDDIAHAWQSGAPPDFNGEVVLDDLHLLLGCLWGNQICSVHGWQWVSLKFKYPRSSWTGDAIVSVDRSLYILPYAYVIERANDKDLDIAIGASIRVIGTEVIPTFPAMSFQNLMHGLQRIVPSNPPSNSPRLEL